MNVHLDHYNRARENYKQAITDEGRRLARLEMTQAWDRYVASQPKRSLAPIDRSYLDDRSGFGPTTIIGFEAHPHAMQEGNVISGARIKPWTGEGRCEGSADYPAPKPAALEVQVDDVVEILSAGLLTSLGWTDYSSVKSHEIRDAINLVRRNPGQYRIVRRGADRRVILV